MIERRQIEDAISENNNALVDIHTHSGFGPFNMMRRRYPSSQSVQDLAFKTAHAGIDFVVTFPFAGATFYFDVEESLAGYYHVPNPIEEFPYHFANRQLFYEASLFGEERVLPFACIYPLHEEERQSDYLEQLAKRDILFGLKLHTLATQYHAGNLNGSPFLQLARQFSLPVLVHSGDDDISHPMNIVTLAEQNSDIRFCIAHAARFNKNVFDYLDQHTIPNLFLDTSPFLSIAKRAQMAGTDETKLDLPYGDPQRALTNICDTHSDKIVWGTDEPWTSVLDKTGDNIVLNVRYQDEANLLRSLPEDLQMTIANKNAKRFLFGN